ncbi:MAG: hypothetical protein QOF27_650 [Gaiellaceae bacterium]|jgi:hypothetical protein|nr:hypothetical protein [Gaiellaceae bacterium]
MAVMTGIVVLVFIFAIGPLAVFFGTDSRSPEDRRSL